MADSDKKTYPILSSRSWWALRKKFKQTIPAKVDDVYLASVLNMSKVSAQTNILPSLKMIGLIDADGNTQDLAKSWRDDKDYPRICKEMLEHIYPKSLLDTASDPINLKSEAKRWFSNQTGQGHSATNKMTAFYVLLHEANLEGEKDAKETAKKTGQENKAKQTRPKSPRAISDKAGLTDASGQMDEVINNFPEIHINVQVHVSADSTPEQVDHLFASIAKHLKEFNARKPR